jgi:phosphomethylpyrimidine synthase
MALGFFLGRGIMTQIELARQGIISSQVKYVAKKENIAEEILQQSIIDGHIVIPANSNHVHLVPCGIGKGLSIKINANIGTSSDYNTLDKELEKLRVAVEFGADTVMDLSTGGNIKAIRQAIIAASSVPIGTVPIYQVGIAQIERQEAIVEMSIDALFDVIEQQAREGVDFMTVHCGVTLAALERLRRQHRVTDVVSRGGAFLIGWMIHNEKENPLYENFDRLLEIAHRYDITLSLGDGMRPGSLADATDRAQIEELITLGELVERARAANVQVIIEGPGHLPLDQITANVQLEKSICRGAPFYVLGPLVTDIAAGYDHITGAIGGAIAGISGADFLCYVTPAEHLSLPDVEDVKRGVIASRIAAHAADIVNNVPGARERDKQMALARKRLDWDTQVSLSLDPEKVQTVHNKYKTEGRACSMCGKYCAMELMEKYLGITTNKC